MTTISDPVSIVRECKGPTLSILWLMLVVRKPVTQEWLERHTGYTDKPVAQALAYLEETGRILRNHSGWVIAAGIQLELPMPGQPPVGAGEREGTLASAPALSDQPEEPQAPEEDVSQEENNSDTNAPGRNNSDSINDDLLIKDQDLGESSLISEAGEIPTPEDLRKRQIELAMIGISLNDVTRPLLALSVEEIRKGHHKAIYKGYKDNTGYIIAVLLGMLKTKKYGKDWVINGERYKEWET